MKLPKAEDRKCCYFGLCGLQWDHSVEFLASAGLPRERGNRSLAVMGPGPEKKREGLGERSLAGSNPDLFFQLLGFEFHFNQMQMKPMAEPQESQCL